MIIYRIDSILCGISKYHIQIAPSNYLETTSLW